MSDYDQPLQLLFNSALLQEGHISFNENQKQKI